MKKLLTALESTLRSGQDAVLVTVVASSGSTPRGSGARMLVTARGRLCGTIGGGAVEYRCEHLAREALAAKASHLEQFLLRKNEVEDLGMVCGGSVAVYFRFLPAGDGPTLAAAEAALRLYSSGEPSWLIEDITPQGRGGLSVFGKVQGLTGPSVPASLLASLTPRPIQAEAEGRLYYAEPLSRGGRVYIFGGGHVAQALVPVLSSVSFRCTVIEDREAFCRPALFSGVEKTLLLQPEEFPKILSVGPEDYLCIMTRGHKDDLACESFALTTPARYIGVIGSRRKTAAVNARLREQGFTDGDLARVSTPIGLAIGAETPEEIAVSIAAQMIQVRAAKR